MGDTCLLEDMLLKDKPNHKQIVLRELALAGDKGISSYLSYTQWFPVHRVPAVIYKLKKLGCKIEQYGNQPATYYLRECPPETAAEVADGNLELLGLLDHYIRVDYSNLGQLTPIEVNIGLKKGELVRVYEGTTSRIERAR